MTRTFISSYYEDRHDDHTPPFFPVPTWLTDDTWEELLKLREANLQNVMYSDGALADGRPIAEDRRVRRIDDWPNRDWERFDLYCNMKTVGARAIFFPNRNHEFPERLRTKMERVAGDKIMYAFFETPPHTQYILHSEARIGINFLLEGDSYSFVSMHNGDGRHLGCHHFQRLGEGVIYNTQRWHVVCNPSNVHRITLSVSIFGSLESFDVIAKRIISNMMNEYMAL